MLLAHVPVFSGKLNSCPEVHEEQIQHLNYHCNLWWLQVTVSQYGELLQQLSAAEVLVIRIHFCVPYSESGILQVVLEDYLNC